MTSDVDHLFEALAHSTFQTQTTQEPNLISNFCQSLSTHEAK